MRHALPLLAALACASCATRATDPPPTTPTTAARTSASTGRESGLAGEKYRFVPAAGYPRPEVDADGLATGNLLLLYEVDFPPNMQASNFHVVSSPAAGGIQTQPITLAYSGGLVGEYDPKDKTKIVPILVSTPPGERELNMYYTVTTTANGQTRTELHGLGSRRLTMPAAGDKVPPPKQDKTASDSTRK